MVETLTTTTLLTLATMAEVKLKRAELELKQEARRQRRAIIKEASVKLISVMNKCGLTADFRKAARIIVKTYFSSTSNTGSAIGMINLVDHAGVHHIAEIRVRLCQRLHLEFPNPEQIGAKLQVEEPYLQLTWPETIAVLIKEWNEAVQNKIKTAKANAVEQENMRLANEMKIAQKEAQQLAIAEVARREYEEDFARVKREDENIRARIQQNLTGSQLEDLLAQNAWPVVYKWKWLSGAISPTTEDEGPSFHYSTAFSFHSDLYEGWLKTVDDQELKIIETVHLPIVERIELSEETVKKYFLKAVRIEIKGVIRTNYFDNNNEKRLFGYAEDGLISYYLAENPSAWLVKALGGTPPPKVIDLSVQECSL
jgi:hypothetical protein